ncbi:MAG: transposase [Candidatus Hydrogenedentes bacterium]|nr:transposase [Candidatus Hydrogenedentota bacterium]
MTRYRESRTLVRKLRRLPGESRDEFKRKVGLLRRHFEQFNVDVSDLCQWLMSLRPNSPKSGAEAQPFWDSFLEPAGAADSRDDSRADHLRRAMFQVVVGWKPEGHLDEYGLNEALLASIRYAKERLLTPTAQKLFVRLQKLNDAHVLVLLKAAADWIVSRYQRGYENWTRGHAEWEKEKTEWESRHPELTPEVREKFNDVFRKLEIRLKRPRVCSWERLQDRKLSCDFAGERIGQRMHAPLCKSYSKFLSLKDPNQRSIENYFVENAQKYLRIRNRHPRRARKELIAELLEKNSQARWFEQAWIRYLKTVGVNEDTIVRQYHGRLPHCEKFDGECPWNNHTDLCRQYQSLLNSQHQSVRDLEPLYREWRRDYLSGPRIPSFRYPSSRDLPMPKIFGSGFFAPDFDHARLRLRLDNMAEGEYLELGFDPWPADYNRQPEDIEITSVHVTFVGTHARVGFRFETPHTVSRFRVSQDEIDLLRSRKYPRRAQDQAFLDEARTLLLGSLDRPESPIRILAVDLGETGAGAALLQGKEFQCVEPLKIIKVGRGKDTLTTEKPKKDQSRGLGLSKEHVGRHLEVFAEEAKKIAQARAKRQPTNAPAPETLRGHDLRLLSRHVRWMIRDWVRLNAQQIIEVAERRRADLIVFESLRGFKAPGYDKPELDKKRRMAFFAYGAVRRKVTEKAVERGMRVVTVPYFYSSQTCSECGTRQQDQQRLRKNKKKRRFICEHQGCRWSEPDGINSDENAARVLGRVFWGEIILPDKVDTTT